MIYRSSISQNKNKVLAMLRIASYYTVKKKATRRHMKMEVKNGRKINFNRRMG